MTQSELKEKIEKLDKAIKSPTTPASFLPSLKSKKEGFESELKNISKPEAPKPAAPKPVAEKPAAPKPAASKPAASKPAAEKPAASKSAKSITMTAAEKCRELLNQDKARKKSEEKRVTTRKKQGKPAKLRPSEVVNKTAKAVQSKVVTMDMSKAEINKLSTGFVMAIRNALNGIKDNAQKHSFIQSIITDLNNIDRKFKKTAEYGGYMADGGETEVEQEQMVTRGFYEDEPYEYARGGLASKFEVGDKVMVDDSGYVKSFHGVDLSKPATITSKNKVKFGGKTYFTYNIETADGRKPYNTAVESKLMPVGMADGGMMAKGGIYSSDDTWVVTFQNQDTGEFEEVTVRANNKSNAIATAEDESGLSNNYKYYSVKKSMAHGGKTQGYDDREDERLAMKYGRMGSKDLDSTRSRRDDARFEERMDDGGMMARGGKLPYSLQKRINNLKGGVTITKEKALQAYEMHIDKGMGGSSVGYKLFKAENKKDSQTLGDLAIDLGRYHSGKKADGTEDAKYLYSKEDGGYMAKGGRPLSAINRDRAYESQDELWEQNYKRQTRPKHPKYSK